MQEKSCAKLRTKLHWLKTILSNFFLHLSVLIKCFAINAMGAIRCCNFSQFRQNELLCNAISRFIEKQSFKVKTADNLYLNIEKPWGLCSYIGSILYKIVKLRPSILLGCPQFFLQFITKYIDCNHCQSSDTH